MARMSRQGDDGPVVTGPRQLLRAGDQQLRTDAEIPRAVSVTRLGPLRLVTFAGGRGFVTYQGLAANDVTVIAQLVAGALAYYSRDPAISRVEWKARAHDRTPRGRGSDSWCGTPRAGRRHRLRRDLGRRHSSGVARQRHLPRPDRGPSEVRPRPREDPHTQRLDQLLRPILERSGLVKVSRTTPYLWQR